MAKRVMVKKKQRKCKICGNCNSGLIRKYGLNICRRCLRDKGEELGFRKF